MMRFIVIFYFLLQKRLSSLLFYVLELVHVLVSLPCLPLTRWTWYEVG